MPKRILPFVASCLFCAAAAADTGYVTDMLRLGLHKASDTSDEPIENLTSGAGPRCGARNGGRRAAGGAFAG